MVWIRNLLIMLTLGTLAGAAQAASFAYVPIGGDTSALVVVDIERGRIVDSIDVGASPDAVAIADDGYTVYVTNRTDNTVTVVDATTNQVMGSPLSVGNSPSGVALNPNTGSLYVVTASAVEIYELPGLSLLKTVNAASGLNYVGQSIAFTADGRYAVVTGNGGVALLSGVSGDMKAELALHPGAKGIGIDPNGGNRFYVANEADNSISVVDIAENGGSVSLSQTRVPLGANTGPRDLAVDPSGNHLYVANYGTASDTGATNGSLMTLDLSQSPPVVTHTYQPDIQSFSGGFEPYHPSGVTIGPADGMIYLAFNVWNSQDQNRGPQLQRLQPNGNTPLPDTTSVKLDADTQLNTNVVGQFVGPDCSICPRAAPIFVEDEYVRPAAMGWGFLALPLLLLLRLRR